MNKQKAKQHDQRVRRETEARDDKRKRNAKTSKALRRLREQNQFLQAMVGRCLVCFRDKDPGDFVRYEVHLMDEGDYMAMAVFGGATMGNGDSEKAAIEAARVNMLEFLEDTSKRARKKTIWRGLGRIAKPGAKHLTKKGKKHDRR